MQVCLDIVFVGESGPGGEAWRERRADGGEGGGNSCWFGQAESPRLEASIVAVVLARSLKIVRHLPWWIRTAPFTTEGSSWSTNRICDRGQRWACATHLGSQYEHARGKAPSGCSSAELRRGPRRQLGPDRLPDAITQTQRHNSRDPSC